MVDILPYLYYTTRGIEAWLSLVERCVRDAEVVGSNPVASTTIGSLKPIGFQAFFLLFW